MSFTIALVGRPNVGKSTLFNILAKKNLAIVEDTPGVTVDYKETIIDAFDDKITLIDTGGISINKHDNAILKQVKEHAISTLKKANVVFFLVDGKEGLTIADKEISNILRKSQPNVILVVNKIDTKSSKLNMPEFISLGFNKIQEISASHKIGLGDLFEEAEFFYQEYIKNCESSKPEILQDNSKAPFLSIAIVGKSNVGKSTLINSLLNEKRLVVTDIPGTTRDSISVYFKYKDNLIRLIDTAGLKRRSKTTAKLDLLSSSDTIRSIIFAQVVILVVDAKTGITKQDLSLASYIIKEGRALIIALNKIDLIDNSKKLLTNIQNMLDNTFSDVKKINIITISALKRTGIKKIFTESVKVYNKWSIIIKTSLLNRWLEPVVNANPPPLYKGRYVKVKFITQIKTRPPTFNLWVNIALGIPKQYISFLQNKMYKDFKLWGIPLRFNIKTSKNPYHKKT